MNTPDTIIEKLRKLIAHEKSARAIGNLAEAEAFAARIQKMLDDHRLGMDEVEYAEREATEPIDWEPVSADEINHTDTYNRKKVKILWQQRLGMVIADANGCRMINASGSKGSKIYFVGRTSDRKLCKMLYIYLVELGEELCMKAAKDDVKEQRYNFCEEKYGWARREDDVPEWDAVAFRGWMKDYRKSWRLGFSDAICKRLAAQQKETEMRGAGTMAMVHIKKDALALNDYLKGKTTKGTGQRYRNANTDGYTRGHETGSAIAITPHHLNRPRVRPAGLLGGGK